MKYFKPVIFFTFFIVFTNVQGKENHIFFETFGNAGAYSLNYERHIASNISARIGFSAVPFSEENAIGIPMNASYHLFVGKNYFEIGLGATYFSAPMEVGSLGDKNAEDFVTTGVLGYCMQSRNGLIVRFVFTPFYYDDDFIPFGGVSFGFAL